MRQDDSYNLIQKIILSCVLFFRCGDKAKMKGGWIGFWHFSVVEILFVTCIV